LGTTAVAIILLFFTHRKILTTEDTEEHGVASMYSFAEPHPFKL
jgi:hypothetical protein